MIGNAPAPLPVVPAQLAYPSRRPASRAVSRPGTQPVGFGDGDDQVDAVGIGHCLSAHNSGGPGKINNDSRFARREEAKTVGGHQAAKLKSRLMVMTRLAMAGSPVGPAKTTCGSSTTMRSGGGQHE